MTEKDCEHILREKGYGIIPPSQYLIDMEESFLGIWEQVKDFTMTSMERAYGLFKAVEHTVTRGLEGDFVECGVWKGGSCMLMTLTLQHFGVTDRCIWLYDTYEGMTEPTEEDVIAWNNKPVSEKWEEDRLGVKNNFGSWAVGLEEVKKNLLSTGYPMENLHFIPGDVSVSLKESVPGTIALLRLDTDWYESTKTELEILYPRLHTGGILIIDDYGHFKGARKAVDEYFRDRPVFFSRLDYTGRIAQKLDH